MSLKPGPLKFAKTSSRCPTCGKRKHRKATAAEKKTAKEKLQGAAARRARTAELRGAVMKRSEGRCELCNGTRHLVGAALQLHHLEGGAGRRREQQKESNCLMACHWCHLGYHHDPPIFFAAIRQWATIHGYALPSIVRKAEHATPRRAAP